jgi:hypothetical protein
VGVDVDFGITNPGLFQSTGVDVGWEISWSPMDDSHFVAVSFKVISVARNWCESPSRFPRTQVVLNTSARSYALPNPLVPTLCPYVSL